MLELYQAPRSIDSQKVRLAMAEKRLLWVDCFVDPTRAEHLDGWYLRLNPDGFLPTLVHDGRAVREPSAINEYLDEAFPEPPLRPADLVERACLRGWRRFVDEVTMPAIRHLSAGAAFASEIARRQPRFRPSGDPSHEAALDAAMRDEALSDLSRTIERMEQALASGPWLLGAAYTLADIELGPVLVRLEDLGHAQLWAGSPRVAAWYVRAAARPAFADAYLPPARDATLAAD